MTGSKNIAAGCTLLVALLLAVWLTLTRLSVSPHRTWPPQPDFTIAMAAPEEEYIEVEVQHPLPVPDADEASAQAYEPLDMDQPSQPAPPTGTDLHTLGPQETTPPPPVTTANPAPVKEKPAPKQPAGAAAANPQPQAEPKSQQTRNTVANAFANTQNRGNANNGKDQGVSGAKDGDPDSGAPKGSAGNPGISKGQLPGGYYWPTYGTDKSSSRKGAVIFYIKVNPDGSVAAITYTNRGAIDKDVVAYYYNQINNRTFGHKGSERRPFEASLTIRFD